MKKKWEKMVTEKSKTNKKKKNGIFTLKEGYLDLSTPFIMPIEPYV